MKLIEVTKTLKSLGWQAFTDEVGDKYTHFHLSDRFVQIIYGLRKNGEDQQFDMTLSLSTNEFSKCCNEIYPKFGYPCVDNFFLTHRLAES